MATDIVQGLFGLTPESYQAQQMAADQAQAMKFAQLNPLEQAAYGTFMGGRQIGNLIGGALGAQDPQLQMITRQQNLLKSINPADEVSLAAGIREASQFSPQLALSLSDALQKLQKNKAEIFKAQRESLSTEQKNAAALADSSGAERGSEDWTKSYKTSLESLTTKKPNEALLKAQAIVDARKLVRDSAEGTPERAQAEDLLRALYKAQITEIGVPGQPTMRQKVAIDPFNPGATPVPIGQPYSGMTSSVSLSPEIKLTNQELDWRKQFLAENKPVSEQGANVRQSLNLLEQSQTSPFADAAFANTVVSAFGGDKQKSKSEIDRLVKAGSLDERIANTLTGFFEGTTSAKTKADQLRVLKAVDKALEARYNSSAKGWNERLTKAKVDPTMVIPDYSSVVGATSAQTSTLIEGKTYVNQKTGQRAKVVNGQLVPE